MSCTVIIKDSGRQFGWEKEDNVGTNREKVPRIWCCYYWSLHITIMKLTSFSKTLEERSRSCKHEQRATPRLLHGQNIF